VCQACEARPETGAEDRRDGERAEGEEPPAALARRAPVVGEQLVRAQIRVGERSGRPQVRRAGRGVDLEGLAERARSNEAARRRGDRGLPDTTTARPSAVSSTTRSARGNGLIAAPTSASRRALSLTWSATGLRANSWTFRTMTLASVGV